MDVALKADGSRGPRGPIPPLVVLALLHLRIAVLPAW